MLFHVDTGNGLPIYEQISRQMKFAVAHGVIRTGDLIPSVREMALKLAVNPNTVARAYRDLQADGVLEPLRGEGLRVTHDALTLCQELRQQLLRDRLKTALLECRRGGLNEAEIRKLIEDILGETSLPVSGEPTSSLPEPAALFTDDH